jgi:hypothetical protein
VITRRFGLDPLDFHVAVKSGIVTIAGRVESNMVALTLLGAVRSVEGTVAVRDRLTYPPGQRRDGPATAATGPCVGRRALLRGTFASVGCGRPG